VVPLIYGFMGKVERAIERDAIDLVKIVLGGLMILLFFFWPLYVIDGVAFAPHPTKWQWVLGILGELGWLMFLVMAVIAGRAEAKKTGAKARHQMRNVAVSFGVIALVIVAVAALAVHVPTKRTASVNTIPLTPSAKPVKIERVKRKLHLQPRVDGILLSSLDLSSLGYEGGSLVTIAKISCWAPSNCVAGGYFDDVFGLFDAPQTAFLAIERNGKWSKAFLVPGLSNLPNYYYGNQNDSVSWVACSSPSDCSAGGTYGTSLMLDTSAFVLDRLDGTWYRAIEVPGLGRLNQGKSATLDTGTCVSAGNCRVIGTYSDSGDQYQVYTDVEINGVWQVAKPIPGYQAFAFGGDPSFSALRCRTLTSCVAQGYTTNYDVSFVAVLDKGVWHFEDHL
jgi:hypothetical protein